MTRTSLHFQGFARPTSNYFRLPNEWTDITAAIDSLAELKVVEYILRHTWGYQEYDIQKHITIDEFMRGRLRRDGTRMDKGTGLSEQSVRNGLGKALTDGLVQEAIDDSDRGRIKKYYCLRMASADSIEVQTLDPEVQTLDPQVQTSQTRGIKLRPRTEKDTLERNHEKDNAPTGAIVKDRDTNWKAELAATMTASNYQRWVAPLELVELVNHHAILRAPDAGTADYARTRLADTLARALNVEGIEVRTAE